MSADFALQALQFSAALGDLAVHVIQRATLIREFVFVDVDLLARFALRFANALDLGPAIGQLAFQRLELLARMMRIERAQVSMK